MTSPFSTEAPISATELNNQSDEMTLTYAIEVEESKLDVS